MKSAIPKRLPLLYRLRWSKPMVWLRAKIDRYWYGETCPYYFGKGKCEESRSCGFYGEPVCITNGPARMNGGPLFRWRERRMARR